MGYRAAQRYAPADGSLTDRGTSNVQRVYANSEQRRRPLRFRFGHFRFPHATPTGGLSVGFAISILHPWPQNVLMFSWGMGQTDRRTDCFMPPTVGRGIDAGACIRVLLTAKRQAYTPFKS